MKRKRKILLKKRNLLIILLSALLFFLCIQCCYRLCIYTGNCPESGTREICGVDGDYWTYRYKKDDTIARNVYLKIDNKCYYFNSKGHRWCSWHTINGKKCYFGTRSSGLSDPQFRNPL